MPKLLQRAIRAAVFQLVTVEPFAVTAEVAGSSPVVPAIPFSGLRRLWSLDVGTKGNIQHVPTALADSGRIISTTFRCPSGLAAVSA